MGRCLCVSGSVRRDRRRRKNSSGRSWRTRARRYAYRVGTWLHTKADPLIGGLSYFSGAYGLAADNLGSVEIVLANGTIVTADLQHQSDLFWALKGGGPNFGKLHIFCQEQTASDSIPRHRYPIRSTHDTR
jgi:hypothetical protein